MELTSGLITACPCCNATDGSRCECAEWEQAAIEDLLAFERHLEQGLADIDAGRVTEIGSDEGILDALNGATT